MQQDVKSRIVGFARHLDTDDAEPEAAAKDRDWLDAQGRPTEAGHDLVEALIEQDRTRTTFRYV